MYTNFASATLIVLGVVIAILGFLLAGNLQMVVIGLLSVLAGGLLGLRTGVASPDRQSAACGIPARR